MSDAALFSYKCTEYYHPEFDRSIAWNDPAIGVEWPITDVQLSAKDAAAPLLREIDLSLLPAHG